jgi:hypothetical protein
MASPWKFLARLASRRQEQKEQQQDPADDVTSASAGPSEPATDTISNSTDQLADAGPETADRSKLASGKAEQLTEADKDVPGQVGQDQGEGDLDSTSGVTAGGRAVVDAADAPVAATRKAPAISLSKPVTSAKRGRNKAASRTSPVEVIPQPQAGVLTFSDEVQSLDGEIRQLREQLARRLQQQNAQLTKMLERFER